MILYPSDEADRLGSLCEAVGLGLDNTSEYKELLGESTIGKGPIKQYISSKAAKFGIPNGKVSYPLKGRFDYLSDPDCVTWYDEKLPLSSTVEGDERGFRSIVCSMHQLVIGAPEYFVAEPQPAGTTKINKGFPNESTECLNESDYRTSKG